MTFDEWHKANAKYLDPADIVAWCETAWRESRKAALLDAAEWFNVDSDFTGPGVAGNLRRMAEEIK